MFRLHAPADSVGSRGVCVRVWALGPAFAGFLFSFSISSGVFAAPYGSVFVFCIVGIMGIFHVVLSFHLKEYYPDEDREPKIINGSVQEQDDADEEKPMF